MAADKPAVLLVEGPDDREVVFRLCNHHRIDNKRLFDVHVAEGYQDLRDRLSVLPKSGFPTVGVVADADSDPAARWASLCGALHACGYASLPDAPSPDGAVLDGPPGRSRIGIWIMPDNQNAGILEDFLVTLTTEGDALLARARSALDAIPATERRFPAARTPKALVHTWLAWQEEPGASLAVALTRRYLDPGAPAAARFADWLRRVFSPT
jgi:hypothetical protein